MAKKNNKKDSGGGFFSSILAFMLLACIVQYIAPILMPIAVGIGIFIAVAFVVFLFGKHEEDDTHPDNAVKLSQHPIVQEVSRLDLQKEQFKRRHVPK